MKVVVLGGSAQSTPLLWSHLINDLKLRELSLVLLGRDRSRLDAVLRACRLLDVRDSCSVEAYQVNDARSWSAAAGADIIIVQIRSGGYSGRAFNETFPLRYGIPGDEGLGPGGLSAGVRNWKVLAVLLDQLQRVAPLAQVAILSSPIGILVRAAQQTFPELRLFGICELPWTTLQAAGGQEHAFDYFGVNHLGWLYGPRNIPLKYSELHFNRHAVVKRQLAARLPRGAQLEELDNAAFNDFRSGSVEEIRRALSRRPAPWYEHAIAPLIAALQQGLSTIPFFISTANRTFNRVFLDDDVLEFPHELKHGELIPCMPHAEPPRDLIELTLAIVRYERVAVQAVKSGNPSDIIEALRAHPWTDRTVDLPGMAREIVGSLNTD